MSLPARYWVGRSGLRKPSPSPATGVSGVSGGTADISHNSERGGSRGLCCLITKHGLALIEVNPGSPSARTVGTPGFSRLRPVRERLERPERLGCGAGGVSVAEVLLRA